MANEQDTLMQRVPAFTFRWEECMLSSRYTLGPANYMVAEQIHLHYAIGECKSESGDIVGFWLNSLFNFLEDRFEDSALELFAAQCLWSPVEKKEALCDIKTRLLKFETSDTFEIEEEISRSYLMLQNGVVTAYLLETENRYAAFYWHAAVG